MDDLQYAFTKVDQTTALWHRFIKIQSVYPEQEYRKLLELYAARGAYMMIVRKNFKVVGNLVWCPVNLYPNFFIDNLNTKQAFDEVGASIDEVFFRACIFVHEDMKGQGIGSFMMKKSLEEGRNRGMKYCINFKFDTEELKSFTTTRKGVISTNYKTLAGETIMFTPVEGN